MLGRKDKVSPSNSIMYSKIGRLSFLSARLVLIQAVILYCMRTKCLPV